MKSVLIWIASGLLVLGALSATVAMVSVKWLYPTSAAGPSPTAPPAAAPEGGAIRAAALSADTKLAEQTALAFIGRAGSGDIAGARAMAADLTNGVYEQIGRLGPVTQRAAALPGGQGVLVWATYRREEHTARGAYQVAVTDGKVTGVAGPFAPDAGYQGLPWSPTDDKGRRVNLDKYLGRGLVIVAPRVPEVELTAALTRMQREFAPQGVDVILAVDLGGPDMTAYARNSGYTGLIWRIKGHIEEAPVVTKGRLLGAAGILVDRTGTVVASLTALDPSRYGLDGQPIEAVAPAVFRAYGLTP